MHVNFATNPCSLLRVYGFVVTRSKSSSSVHLLFLDLLMLAQRARTLFIEVVAGRVGHLERQEYLREAEGKNSSEWAERRALVIYMPSFNGIFEPRLTQK